MHQRTAVVFPGQGGYLPGTLTAMAHLDEVAEVLDQVDKVDKVAAEPGTASVSALLTDRGAPLVDSLVRDPERLHLAIYAGSIASWRLLSGRAVRREVHPPRPPAPGQHPVSRGPGVLDPVGPRVRLEDVEGAVDDHRGDRIGPGQAALAAGDREQVHQPEGQPHPVEEDDDLVAELVPGERERCVVMPVTFRGRVA